MNSNSELSVLSVALLVLVSASSGLTASTAAPSGSGLCTICHHNLELLTLQLSVWKQAISDSLAAEQQGIHLNIAEADIDFSHITSEWEGEDAETKCYKPLGSLSNALSNFTKEGIRRTEDVSLDDLKWLRTTLLTEIENFGKHRNEEDKREWDFYAKKIQEFTDVALEKLESVVAVAVVEILKNGDTSDNTAKVAVDLMKDSLETLDCDEMRDVINVAYSDRSKVNDDMTRKLMKFGKGVWPDRPESFYGKLSRKLSKLITEENDTTSNYCLKPKSAN